MAAAQSLTAARRSPRDAPQPWSHGPGPANGAIKMPGSRGETGRAGLSRRR